MAVLKLRVNTIESFVFLHILCMTVLFIELSLSQAYKDEDAPLRKPINPSGSGSPRPHIILIVADDLGYNDVSFHGSDQIPTPNIDFLAYQGVILNNYYVSPICTPTRSALLTGRHPIHTGLQHGVISGSEPYGLPLNETLLPQYLNQLGYRSHMVGKWHLGFFKWPYTPTNRGFETHLGFYQGCGDYYTHTYEKDLDQWGLDYRSDKTLLRNCTGLYSTAVFRDEAVRIIERHDKSEPLFLYLPFQAVHSGNDDGPHLQAPESYIRKFTYIHNNQRRTYAAMLSALDDAVGDIYDSLRKRHMLENSIIVFTTDNGGPPNGFNNNAANNFPLRGGKNTLWEGGVRGVGLIHSSLLQHQGYVSNKMLHVCDWLPTLISAAGGRQVLGNLTTLDGVDAWEMLSTDGASVRTEILHNIDPAIGEAAIRVGDYKLLVGHVNMQWSGWYPPYQLSGDDVDLNYLTFSGSINETESLEKILYRTHLEKEYRSLWPTSVAERMHQLYTFAEESKLYTSQYSIFIRKGVSKVINSSVSRKPGIPGGERFSVVRFQVVGKPVQVHCGPKPSNASSNCRPSESPCLYHIPSDPCEYNNIAHLHNGTVFKILSHLEKYASTMVPILNKPFDPKGNPRLHDGAWVPWR